MSNIPYLSTVEEPEEEPLTLAETKSFLRVDLIKSARQIAEEYLSKSLITQTLQLQFDHYAPAAVNLMRGPVQEIVAVIIVAQDFSESILSTSGYHLSAGNRQVVFDVAPMGQIIQLQYIAGYGDAADVPAPIKQGMLEHITGMYENRGQNDLPANVRSCYAPYRAVRV